MYHIRLSKLLRILAPQKVSPSEICNLLRRYNYDYSESPDQMIEESAVHKIAHKYGVRIPIDVYKNDWFGYLTIRRRVTPEVYEKHPWLHEIEKCDDYEQCAEIINRNYEGVFQMDKEGNITQLKLAPFSEQFLLAALFSEKIHWFMFKLGRDSFDEALLRDIYQYKYNKKIKWNEKDGILEGHVEYKSAKFIIDEGRVIDDLCKEFRLMF